MNAAQQKIERHVGRCRAHGVVINARDRRYDTMIQCPNSSPCLSGLRGDLLPNLRFSAFICGNSLAFSEY